MHQPYNIFKIPEQAKFYLASPNHKILCAFNGIDESSCSLKRLLNDTYELNLDVNRYILYKDTGISKLV